MARGLFSGFLVGTVVSGVAVGTVSVLNGPPVSNPPDAAALEVPAGSEFDQSREDREAELPATQEAPDAGSTPRVAAPEPDDLSSLQGADMAPAGQPETAQPEGGMSQPATGEDAAGVDVDSDSPVLPSPQSMAPEAPAGEDELSISTEPAQPAPPEIEEGGAFDAPETPEALEAPEASEEPMQEEPAQEAPPDTTEAQPPVPQTPQEEADEEQAMPDDAPGPDEDAADDQAKSDQANDENAPRTGMFDNMAEGVTTGRLPSVTDDPEVVAPEEDEAETDSAATEEDMRPPLERFAVPFDNPEDKPLMSIVLIDDGGSGIGLEALSDFPYPVSFAVDPGWPGAAEAARKYRDAGFEVLAMADLPPGASATDTEVAIQAQMAVIPEAVAVFELPGADLQSNREASEQLAAILLDSGHGLVMYPRGAEHRAEADRQRGRALDHGVPRFRRQGAGRHGYPPLSGSGRLQGRSGRKRGGHGGPFAPRHDQCAFAVGVAGPGQQRGSCAGIGGAARAIARSGPTECLV
ncbi:MAG: divergent polysaccharide deacetylase family protein [Roseovarius pacificus]|nr:divergent polysaccharide deacetylase family protein [Roseovarius pacificus]